MATPLAEMAAPRESAFPVSPVNRSLGSEPAHPGSPTLRNQPGNTVPPAGTFLTTISYTPAEANKLAVLRFDMKWPGGVYSFSRELDPRCPWIMQWLAAVRSLAGVAPGEADAALEGRRLMIEGAPVLHEGRWLWLPVIEHGREKFSKLSEPLAPTVAAVVPERPTIAPGPPAASAVSPPSAPASENPRVIATSGHTPNRGTRAMNSEEQRYARDFEKSEEDRATITLYPGDSPKAVDDAEGILVALAESLKLYQRAGEVVRIITLESPKHSGGLCREAGTVQLAPVGVTALTEIFDRHILWQKMRGKDGASEPARIDCPGKIGSAYLSRLGSWHLPVLTGIVSAPIMRPDGTVLCRAGYDPATGLFLTEDWPELNGNPSRGEALKALDVLLAPYAEFPFVGDADRSVFAAAILTAIQRRLLPSAPLFGFNAPAQRTGKTLLAECVAITAVGRPAPAMAVSGDREEIRKAVAAALREGHSIVNLDNIEQPLGSPDLSRAITQPEYADRILGETRLLRLPTNVLWTATGNNLTFRGDLTVRALVSRLDAKLERPEERQFKIVDLKGSVAEHRRELVIAAITILRAYSTAGSPDQQLKPWGGFDEWSRVIRAPLVWLGMADPCATRKHLIEDDPDREQAAALLSVWHSVFGCEAVLIAHVIERAASSPELTSSLLAVAASRNDANRIDPRRVGWWCREWHDRIVDGLSLVRSKKYGNAATWKVMQRPDSGVSGGSGVKYPPTRTKETGEEGEKAPGRGDFDFHRGGDNSTNPSDYKNEPMEAVPDSNGKVRI